MSATFRFEVTDDQVNIQSTQKKSSSIKVEPKISPQSASVNKAASKDSQQQKKNIPKKQSKTVSANGSSKASKASQQNAKVVKKNASKGSRQQKKNIPKKQSKTVSANGSYKASKVSQQKRKAAKKVPVENIAVKKEDPSTEKPIKIQF